MANQGLKSDGKLRGPVDSAVVINKGYFLYWDANDLKPASSQADQLSEGDNQGLFASKFAGIAEGHSADGDTDDILVDYNQNRERLFKVASATYEVGDLLGIDEAASGTALEPDTLTKVTEPDVAIAVVTERQASASATVKGRLIRGGAPTKFPAIRMAANIETLAGNKTLTLADATLQVLDPDGAKDLILPPEAVSAGRMFVVVNKAGGAEVITIKNDADGTICTPTQAETAVVWCDGTTWHGLVGANS